MINKIYIYIIIIGTRVSDLFLVTYIILMSITHLPEINT